MHGLMLRKRPASKAHRACPDLGLILTTGITGPLTNVRISWVKNRIWLLLGRWPPKRCETRICRHTRWCGRRRPTMVGRHFRVRERRRSSAVPAAHWPAGVDCSRPLSSRSQVENCGSFPRSFSRFGEIFSPPTLSHTAETKRLPLGLRIKIKGQATGFLFGSHQVLLRNLVARQAIRDMLNKST